MTGADAYRLWGRIADKACTLLVRGSFQEFGSQTTIQRPLRLKGERRISIGSGVFVGGGSWLMTVERDGEPPPVLTVGDRTSIAGLCVLAAAAEVRVGCGVLFARNVYVSDHNHAYRDIARPVLDQGIDGLAAVLIDDGAWLGQNVVVCPGATIGAGAVVAANSVVKGEVPPHSLAAGAPARVVRSFAPSARIQAG